MRKGLVAAAALLLLNLPTTLNAKDEPFLREIKAKEPIDIKADKAYLLFRTNAGVGPVFLRIPTEAEQDAYLAGRAKAFAEAEPKLIKAREGQLAKKEAAEKSGKKFSGVIPPVPTIDNFTYLHDGKSNIGSVNAGKTLEKTKGSRTLLVEMAPGEYVFYGVGFNGFLHTCLCLGTISVEAKSGEITDFGEILVAAAAVQSDIPELSKATSLGYSMNGHIVTWSVALKPAGTQPYQPSLLAGKKISSAQYRPVGKFVSPFAFNINRLEPIEGLLQYDRGNVVDPKTGETVKNQY